MTIAPATGAPLTAVNGHALPGQPVTFTKPTPTATHETPTNVPPTQGPTPNTLKFTRAEWVLVAFAFLMAAGVSVIGLISSYHAVEQKAALPVPHGGWGWGDGQAWMLPIGIDLSILAFSLIHLLLIRADRPAAWIKWVPRLGAAGTIYLNWESSTSLPAQIGHAVLAGLWVVFSEIGAHLYAAHIGEARGRVQMDRIRLSRWILQPISTARISRQMKMYEITSYNVALTRDQEWGVYKTMLRQKHGRRWRSRASSTELTPLQLRSNGLTLDEALEVPDLQKEKAEARARSAELRKAHGEIQRIKAESEINAAKLHAKTQEVEAEGSLKVATAKAETAASIAVQLAEADLQVHQAEAQAQIQQTTEEAAAKAREIAEAEERRRAEAARQQEKDQFEWDMERQRLEMQKQLEADALADEIQAKETEEAARARLAAQEADRAAAQAAKVAADARRQAAEADRVRAEAARKASEDLLKAAEAEAARKASERRAAEDEKAAAQARFEAAEKDKAAALAEAEARLSPVERDARQVADMLRTDPDMTLDAIATALGVSIATASGRRKRAMQILQEAQ